MTGWMALKRLVVAFCNDKAGGTAIEYTIVLAAVAGTVTAVVYALGGKVQTVYFAKLVNLY